MNHLFRNIRIYFLFLGKEFISPLNYFMALLIGITINYFQGLGVFSSFVPFIVPVIVQSFSKSSVKFGNRNMKLLVRLPSEKKDPAFVINPEGEIVASEGKTKSLFKSKGIHSMYDIFEEESKSYLEEAISESCQSSEYYSYELFSKRLKSWYSVHTKRDSYSNNVLVWFDDVTARMKLDQNLIKLRDFSKQIMLELHDKKGKESSLDKLASFVLDEGYRGIFIARKGNDESLRGCVYKMKVNGIVTSDKIVISKDSDAPIWKSRRERGIISDEVSNYKNQDDFERARPFDPRVKDFLSFRISNFINYHEEDISVIVFNKVNEITQNDLIFMEAIVNSAFTTSYLKRIIENRA